LIDLARSLDLRRGQTGRRCGILALQRRWIEAAAFDVTDDAVLQSISRITRSERTLCEQRIFLLLNEARLVLVSGLPHPHLPERVTREIRRHRDHRDRVVVVGVALRRAERGDCAATRFSHDRRLRRAAVERAHHRLRGDRHLVRGAIAEVLDLLRVVDRVARVAFVTGVAAHRRVAASYSARERIRVRAGAAAKAAIARAAQLAIPSGSRHPHFDLDVRVGARPHRGRDLTQRREIGERIATSSGGRRTAAPRWWRRQRAGSDKVRAGHHAACKLHRRQLLARRVALRGRRILCSERDAECNGRGRRG
jgi:hypothetical protein